MKENSDLFPNVEENFLRHYGIPGMKWGVRRYQNKDGTLTPAGKKRRADSRSEDRKEYDRLRSKRVKELSNKEIQTILTRADLEKRLSNIDKSVVDVGREIAGQVFREVGKETAKGLVKKVIFGPKKGK